MLLQTGGHSLWTPASRSWHLFTHEILVLYLFCHYWEMGLRPLDLGGTDSAADSLRLWGGCMASCWFSLL